MKGRGEKEAALILAKNVQHLRRQLDLTVHGLAVAVRISANYLRLVEAGKCNVTLRMIGKIADLAGLEIIQLLSPSPPKIKKPDQLPLLRKFRKENLHNTQYFISRQGEDGVARFVKDVLLAGGYFSQEREVREVVSECRRKYGKDFSSKEISQQLSRLAQKGILKKRDRQGTRQRFLYKENKK